MKKAEKEKIIRKCFAEYESTDFANIYPAGSWKEFRQDVRNLYGIVRGYFGKAEAKRITVDYFAEVDTSTEWGSTFANKLQLAQCQEALAAVK